MILKLVSTQVAKNTLNLIFVRGLQIVSPIITLPYLLNTIGVANFGVLCFSATVCAFLGAFTQYGLGLTGTREIARTVNYKKKLSHLYSLYSSGTFILAAFCIIFGYLLYLNIIELNKNYIVFWGTMLFVISQSLLPLWFIQGVEKFNVIALSNFGSNVLYLIGIFTFVRNEDDFWIVPIVQAATAIINQCFFIFFIRNHFGVIYIAPSLRELKEFYVKYFHGFIYQISPMLYNNTTLFLLGLYVNSNEFGVFSSVVRILDLIMSVGYILTSAFLPSLSKEISKFSMFRNLLLTLGALLFVGVFVLSNFIGVLLGMDNSDHFEFILRSLSVSIFFIFFSLVYGNAYFMLVGEDVKVKNINLYVSLIFFILALFFIPRFGVLAAIFILVGARFAIFLLQLVLLFNHKRDTSIKSLPIR